MMWPFDRKNLADELNTVDLGGDLDGDEMLQSIERTFKIRITDDEAKSIVSVGDLYNIVKQKMPSDGSVDPLWVLIVDFVRNASGSSNKIDQDTTFFPEDAEKRN